MYECFAYTYICAIHACLGAMEAREDYLGPETEVMNGCELPCLCCDITEVLCKSHKCLKVLSCLSVAPSTVSTF